MKKKVYSRNILSALLAVAVILGCLPMALLGASAATVDYVVSDDFAVDGKAMVNGAATERDAVWAYYDYAAKLADHAQDATIIEGGATVSTKKSSDVVDLANTANGIYTYKDWPAADKLSQMVVDHVAYSLPGRYNDVGICVYFNPATGESIALFPNSRGGAYYQICLGQTYYANDTITNGPGNNNYYDCANNGLTDYNLTAYPDGLYQRFIINYTYTEDTLASIEITTEFYGDSQYSNLLKTHTATIKVNSGVFDNSCSNVTYSDDFIAGIRGGASTSRSSIDAMKLVFAHEATKEELTAEAEAFVAAHKANLLLSAGDVNAQNAASVMETVNAYALLNSEVQAILANIEIDGAVTNVGEKISELNAAAAPFVPTENQIAFETYYNNNEIGSMASITDAAIIEEALRLYNLIEATHKGNVVNQYTYIVALIKSSYVKTTASQETVTLPGSDYPQICAIVTAAVNNDSYASKINLKFNAYQIFNNSTSRLYIPFMTMDDAYLGLSFERGGTTTDNGNIQGIYLRRYMSSNVADKIQKWEESPDSYVFSSDSFSPNQSLNGTHTSAATEAATRALFMEDPIITQDNPYMSFCYETGSIQATESEPFGAYKLLVYFKYAVYYDANDNGVFDEGEYAIANVGYNENSSSSLLAAFKSEDTNMIPVGYRIEGDAQYKDAVVVTNLLNVGDLTPAKQFIADHSSVLNSPAPNADDTLAMYIAYNALEPSVKTEVDDMVTTPVETVVDNAKVRPTTNGATIRTNVDQNIAFYTAKPQASTSKFRIKEMGSVICGLGYAIEQELTMTKGEEGTVFGSKEYTAGDPVDGEVLTYLKGTDISSSENWGTFIVARSFVVYTDGTTDLILYSTNKDDKNTTDFDDEFDSTGMVIRSVNQIIKSIATAVKFNGTPDLYEQYKGTANAFTIEYAGVSYAEIINSLDTDGVVLTEGSRDAVATVKMLVAYNDLIAAIVNQ